MQKRVLMIVLSVFMVLVLSGCGKQSSSPAPQTSESGKIICNDMPCLAKSFQTCTPAELKMTNEGKTAVITVQGMENERCHYSMVFDGITAADCNFKVEDLKDMKLFNQLFGNKEGKDAIIAEACGTAS